MFECVFKISVKNRNELFSKVKQHDGITIVEKSIGESVRMSEWNFTRNIEKRGHSKRREKQICVCLCIYVLAHKTNCGNETIQNKTEQNKSLNMQY